MKHRHKITGPGRPAAEPHRSAGRPSLGTAPAQAASARRWLFRLLAALILPVLVLGLAEIALRLGGYGFSPGFFKPMRMGGRDMLVENDAFGCRFFPPDIARMPESLRLAAHKPPGTYRIFILGESAALGDPEPAFGAGRYLDVLLRARYPKAKFEVVNVAMTAINSHAILPIARDCARQEGDLWIIYMGNNEMVGPFGAATVFGAKAPPWQLVRLTLAIQDWRLGQLLAAAGRKLFGKNSGEASWQGMNMFAGNLLDPDSPLKQAVYRNFERNLQDILRTGLDSGARILLSTVAVNLKDCPPFASLVSGQLSSGDRARVAEWIMDGNSMAATGKWEAAVERYDRAAQLNPQSAELEFRLGTCLSELSNRPAAWSHFQKACDLDRLPFRADTRINTILADAGRRMAGAGLTLVDAASAIEAFAADGNGIPGRENFYEHVHLNFDGNYRLARGWADKIAPLLPSALRDGERAAWAPQAECERRLGLSDWDRWYVLDEVCRRLQQPPLSGQLNNADRLRFFQAEQAQLRKNMDSDAARQARQTYVEALDQAPEDCFLLKNFAFFLADQGDIAGAVEQWQKVRALIPQDHTAYYELGRLAARQGRLDEARSWIEQAVALHPNFTPGWFELGNVLAASGNYAPAVKAFDRVLQYQPGDARCWFCDGLALAKLGLRAEAIQHYRQATKIAPNDWQAHFELGGLLGLEGNMLEAKNESEAAIRLNPGFPRAHLNLGLALVQMGRFEEAKREFEETLRLDPTNAKAADYLSQTKVLQKQNQ